MPSGWQAAAGDLPAPAGAALTMLRHLPSLARAGLVARDLTGPFGRIVDQEVTNPWLRNLLDLECFVLRHASFQPEQNSGPIKSCRWRAPPLAARPAGLLKCSAHKCVPADLLRDQASLTRCSPTPGCATCWTWSASSSGTPCSGLQACCTGRDRLG